MRTDTTPRRRGDVAAGVATYVVFAVATFFVFGAVAVTMGGPRPCGAAPELCEGVDVAGLTADVLGFSAIALWVGTPVWMAVRYSRGRPVAGVPLRAGLLYGAAVVAGIIVVSIAG